MTEINAGDWVRFIENDDLGWTGSRKGHVYEVVKSEGDDDYDIVWVNDPPHDGDRTGAYKKRFEKVPTSLAELQNEFESIRVEAQKLRDKGYDVTLTVTKTITETL
jgi:hypothetical protein